MGPGSPSAPTLPLSPKQVQSIVEAEGRRIACWEGAVRSGKTFASCLAFCAAVAEVADERDRGDDPTIAGLIVITGRTLQTIERNIIEPMQNPALFGPLARSVQHTRGASIANILGQEVHLIGAADARAEGKLRGLTARLALVDEATLLPEEFWTQLLARLSATGARLLATTNPGGPNHWLKTKYLDRRHDPNLDIVSWKFTLDDNPALPETFKRSIKAENTGMFYQRNVLGLWVAAEGAVYPMWDPERHVIASADLPRMDRVLTVGIDYGDNHATRGYLLGMGPDVRPGAVGSRLYVLAEWAPRPMTIGRFSEDFRRWLDALPVPDWRAPEWIAYDSAARAFGRQLYEDGFSNVRQAHKSVLPGIQTVAGLLDAGKLVVADTCKRLIQEIPGYLWDAKATERGEDKPIKADDDSADALRYAVYTSRLDWRDQVPLTPSQTDLAA